MTQTDRRQWLPQFCMLPTLFAVMVVAELVALILVLAPEHAMATLPSRLGVTSVYVQWLALLNAVVLCSLRVPLSRLSAPVGVAIAWLSTTIITALASWLIHMMDVQLGLNLTVPSGDGAHFVFVNVVISALIAAALLRYLFVIEQWRERVRAASKAQVDALQARIRPHFLFNSMNTIASLIRTRPVDAERAVEDLSDLFRAALGAGDTMGTLGEELDLVDEYLRIEQWRLGSRLRVERDLDHVPRDLPLPRLLLQPLIENAVYHGIARLPNGGTITITGRHLPGRVELVIGNPCLAETAPTRNGHALDDIRARIGYHFGNDGEISVEPSSDRFTVTVRLPDKVRDENPRR
ncbi:MAG: histidine kinase [Dokdonella sp.]